MTAHVWPATLERFMLERFPLVLQPVLRHIFLTPTSCFVSQRSFLRKTNYCNLNGQTPHETIYGHKKKVCLKQNISIGSNCMEYGHFMLHFTTFHNVYIYIYRYIYSYIYICEMPTKASNGLQIVKSLKMCFLRWDTISWVCWYRLFEQ